MQAMGVTLYCSIVAFIMWNGEDIFGGMINYFAPLTFLLLFLVSALSCALMVFYKPYMLFLSGKKKEAGNLVLYTTGWLILFFFVFLSIVLVSRSVIGAPAGVDY